MELGNVASFVTQKNHQIFLHAPANARLIRDFRQTLDSMQMKRRIIRTSKKTAKYRKQSHWINERVRLSPEV